MQRESTPFFHWCEKLLRLLLPESERQALLGDYEELYKRLSQNRGRIIADFWYIVQILLRIPRAISEKLQEKFTWMRHSAKIAFRNLVKYRLYSFIRIFGLSTGIAACFLIFLFVRDEISYDRFHENGDNLYRLVRIAVNLKTGKEAGLQPFIPPPTGSLLAGSFIEIQHQSRFTGGSGIVRYRDRIFGETVSLADSPFFEMFTFPLLRGSPRSALTGENHIVLTQSVARKYFTDENPIGKTLSISFGQFQKDFIVTAMAEDVPPNSSIQFDMIIPFDNLPMVMNERNILNDWNRWYCPLFVQLKPGFSSKQMEERLRPFYEQHFGRETEESINSSEQYAFGLQNIRDIYLNTRGAGAAGLTASFLLSAIGLAVLLIACVNYTNLSIGLVSLRAKEVGLRKVVGAQRRQILRQFLGESILISFIAVLFGILLIELLIPKFNVLSGKRFSPIQPFEFANLFGLSVLTIMTGIVAGIYPSLVISAFRPIEILKGRMKAGGKQVLIKGLIVFQFSLTVILVLSTITLGRQVSFMAGRELGYVSDGLVVIPTQENELLASERVYRLFRDEIRSYSKILGVAASNREFGLFLPSAGMQINGREFAYRFDRVDRDFLSTMKIRVVQGRDFYPDPSSDQDAVIVNQKFMDEMGSGYHLGEMLGAPSDGFPSNARVIGIMADAHFRSLRSEIEPLLLYVGQGVASNRDRFSLLFVRIAAEDVGGTLDFLKKAWEKIQPDKPFNCYFQDDALESLYNNDKRWNAIVRYASAMTLVLACLGIFGLTALTLSRRRKEFGIRKVVGAGTAQIVYSSIKEFMLLVSLSNLIAWPVAFFILRRVLQNYPYRVGIGFPYFVLTGLASLLIAVLTILYLSVRAAMANPVESLRQE